MLTTAAVETLTGSELRGRVCLRAAAAGESCGLSHCCARDATRPTYSQSLGGNANGCQVSNETWISNVLEGKWRPNNCRTKRPRPTGPSKQSHSIELTQTRWVYLRDASWQTLGKRCIGRYCTVLRPWPPKRYLHLQAPRRRYMQRFLSSRSLGSSGRAW
ncbi:hypothetical protein LX36DRAFT_142533 [Colletotrichum falcatum]|nr:hypothetical protein LX36DRAFT_142533 [Colletotrichum falcatum]